MTAYDLWLFSQPGHPDDGLDLAIERKLLDLMADPATVRDAWDEHGDLAGIDVAAAVAAPPSAIGCQQADRIERALRLLEQVERQVANALEDRAQAEVIAEIRASQEDAAMAAAGL